MMKKFSRTAFPVNVTVLQIRRVAMIRKYPDGRMTMRNVRGSDWVALPGSYETNVTRAIRIAQEVTTRLSSSRLFQGRR